jgi:uncharacterized protein YneF (UPF0154 family)
MNNDVKCAITISVAIVVVEIGVWLVRRKLNKQILERAQSQSSGVKNMLDEMQEELKAKE